MKPYEQIYDGEWFRWNWKGNMNMCCDCRLVHSLEFKVKDGHLWMRCWRDGRATGGARRYLGSMKKRLKQR
jgi:hypothetical protein